MITDRIDNVKSYLHHSRPPLTVDFVVLPIVVVDVLLLNGGAALLSDFSEADWATHVDDSHQGEDDRYWDQPIHDGLDVRFFAWRNDRNIKSPG